MFIMFIYVHCHIIVNNPVLVSSGRYGGSWSKGAPASSKSPVGTGENLRPKGPRDCDFWYPILIDGNIV